MARAISDSRNKRAVRRKRGRPKTGIGKPTGLRLYADLEAAIDRWIARQPKPRPSKPAAIRQLIERGLER